MRKVTVLVTAAASVLALALPAVAQARDPILFVHGWNSSASTWNTMVGRFAADGWTSAELNTWSYNTAQSNATTASQLATRVNAVLAATGTARLDLVSHSMGGLSTRYYVKNLSGGPKVDEFVSLAGPNHGTGTANLCFWNTSCFEMRPGSSFLNALNSGDETPSTPRYGTWWSPCDEVINPDTSTILSGAANTQTPCLSHSGVKDSASVYAQVREFVR
jgi:triacylglycerol esterase/lipase EstA (alpha/beta hydrolase family)